MHFLPFRRRPFADGKSPMNLSAVAGVGAADFSDQRVAFMQLTTGVKLRRHGKIRLAHGHAAHEVNARVAAGLEIHRLNDRGDFILAHAGLESLRHRLDRLVGELRRQGHDGRVPARER